MIILTQPFWNSSDMEQGKWSSELNSVYKECFEVDLDSICGRRRPQPPLVPVYRPWVKIHEINDVKVDDIKKFTWRDAM